jgi:hypothetical protein
MLPDPVVPGRSAKTHGAWRDGTGVARPPVISGEHDEAFLAARDLIRRLDPRRASERVASHVEIKIAAIMDREDMDEAIVLINNVPCGIRDPENEYVCDKILPRLLKPGRRLIVEGVYEDGRQFWKIYTGGQR